MVSLEAFGIGLALGFSLAAPPGPIIAQMAVDTARGDSWRGFRVGLGATVADGTFFVLTYLGLLQVLPGDPVLAGLSLLGAGLMTYFAYGAWKTARRPLAPPPRILKGFPSGYLLAALSPFNIAWWLTAGATFLALHGATLAGGFLLAILGIVAGYSLLFHFGTRRIKRMETYVSYASAALLLGFAGFLVHHAWTLWM